MSIVENIKRKIAAYTISAMLGLGSLVTPVLAKAEPETSQIFK